MANGNSVSFEWVARYEGEYTNDTVPEYQPKGYGAELAECQRYFFTDNIIIHGTMYTGNGDARTYIPFPVPMRVTPTVSLSAQPSLIAFGAEGNVTNVVAEAQAFECTQTALCKFHIANYSDFTKCGSLVNFASNVVKISVSAEIL